MLAVTGATLALPAPPVLASSTDGGRHGVAAPEKRPAYSIKVHPPGHDPTSLFVTDTGRGQPLVLLHGLGASGYSFREIVPDLSRRYRVITVDLKGHGRSEKPFDTNYAARDQAVLIYWMIRQLGLSRVTLVGHSFGGQVALTLAVLLERYDRRRIARLVLMNAPVYPQKLTPMVEMLRLPVLPYVALTVVPKEVPIAFALMRELIGEKHHLTMHDVAIYAAPYAEAGARHALIQTALQVVPEDAGQLIARFPFVRQKALLIYCRDDRAVPLTTGQRLSRELPRARLTVLDGCDHVAPEQQPVAVLAAMRAFLQPSAKLARR